MAQPRLCCGDNLVEFNKDLDLWLKPYSKMTITVTLPTMRTTGQSISSWEILEKLKKKARPHHFKTLKVVKSSIEFIRFEGDCDSHAILDGIMSCIDGTSLKLSGFIETLKVRCARVKYGPTRHEWESYFRDKTNMDEMKPGHRPDTMHVENLPVKWFGGDRPDCMLLVKVFGSFGVIRRFHIPMLDAKKEENGFKRFSFNDSLSFDAFIQYRDYISFVKAMDTLRGMKMVKELTELKHQKERFLEYEIKIDFDKTKHLSDKLIKKRKVDRLAMEVGVSSVEELKRLKEEARKEQEIYDSQMKECEQEGKRTSWLISLVEERFKERQRAEEAKQAEAKVRKILISEEERMRDKLLLKRRDQLKQQLKMTEIDMKKRLVLEEAKLRNKLIERKRESLRQKAKGKLTSVANVNTNIASTLSLSSSSCTTRTDPDLHSSPHCNPLAPDSNGYHNNSHNDNVRIEFSTNSHLYKKHKRSCKYFKSKSLVVKKKPTIHSKVSTISSVTSTSSIS